MNDDSPMLQVAQLTKTYRLAAGPLTVLRAVSFDIAAGATVAIVGPSGSGKTTLLGLCAGLDRPTAGTVSVAGTAIGGLDEDARARVRNAHIGFVFQNFQLIPTLTALENVLVPVELAGDFGREPEARALLARVGLGERLAHFPGQLSGGERQRVAVARALVMAPSLVLADEPTGALDQTAAQALVELLLELNSEEKTTLIVVTHAEACAQRMGRQVRLSDGRFVV